MRGKGISSSTHSGLTPSSQNILKPLRHFLSIGTCSASEINIYLQKADLLKKKRDGGNAAGHAKRDTFQRELEGRSIAAIFEKPSTRTRSALCVAAFEEGALAQCLSPSEIHLGEKESISDTAQVLSQYYSAVAWRGHSHHTVEDLARSSTVPVINLLSDFHHPTQALADVQTMIQEFPEVAGKQLVFLGDVTNNVARSLCEIAELLDFTVVLSGPERLLETGLVPSGRNIVFEPNPVKAAAQADVLYTDVWTSMGFEESCGDLDFAPYQVNKELFLATGKDSTIFMHCLPAKRDKEVTSEVMDSKQSRVLQQAENRLHTIKALLCELL